jgi:hypothetical protein
MLYVSKEKPMIDNTEAFSLAGACVRCGNYDREKCQFTDACVGCGRYHPDLFSPVHDFPYLAHISLGITARFIVLQSKGDLEILKNEGWTIRGATDREALALVNDLSFPG